MSLTFGRFLGSLSRIKFRYRTITNVSFLNLFNADQKHTYGYIRLLFTSLSLIRVSKWCNRSNDSITAQFQSLHQFLSYQLLIVWGRSIPERRHFHQRRPLISPFPGALLQTLGFLLRVFAFQQRTFDWWLKHIANSLFQSRVRRRHEYNMEQHNFQNVVKAQNKVDRHLEHLFRL